MGVTYNKSENLSKIGSGNVRYISWINEEISVDMESDDIGVVKARAKLKMVVFDIKVTTIQNVTAVFVNVNGNWRLAGGREVMIS